MIDDSRKSQIIEEETFRREVQDQLKRDEDLRKRSRFGKAISFFNSTLGVWILSAMILGLVPFLYSLNQSQKALRERTYQLDVEAAIRLNQFRNRVNHVVMFAEVSDALADLSKPRTADATIVFPGYKDRGLTALLVDLLSTVPAEDKSEIQTAINAAQRLEYFSVQYQVVRHRLPPDQLIDKGVEFKDLEEIYRLSNGDLRLRRWGKLSLPEVKLE